MRWQNGAEIGFAAILDEGLRRKPGQNAGFYFFCMSGLPAFHA